MKREIVSRFAKKFHLTSAKQEQLACEVPEILENINNSQLFSDMEEEQQEIVVGGYFGVLWFRSSISRYY